MSADEALRASEILLACAFLLQSLEHLKSHGQEQLWAVLRIVACIVTLAGLLPSLGLLALLGLSIWALIQFNGPYNGGADRMGLLVLICLLLARILPSYAEIALGYLALQVILSYFISGWVKIVNPDWRSGRALSEVFLFSAYPVSEDLRELATRWSLLFAASWSVMLFELAFPLALLSSALLLPMLALATCFHLANAVLFGLNRFVWVWLSAYPVLIWFQGRVF